MKKTSHLALASIALAAPALSMAAGQITFKGKVIDQTCSVKVENTESPTVELPTVSTGQLAVTGARAGLKPFTLMVSECKKGAAEVKINPVFAGADITSSGRLRNTATTGAAQSVEIELLSDAGETPESVISLASGAPVSGVTLEPGTDGSASHQFAARYYATGPVTVGDVQAVVNYDIVYQ